MTTNAERTSRTRTALVDAALGMFGARGYASVSTADIVDAAGVSRGALYHHFEDKRAVFLAVLDTVNARLARSMTAAAAGSSTPDDRLRRMIAAIIIGAARAAAAVVAHLPTARGCDVRRALEQFAACIGDASSS